MEIPRKFYKLSELSGLWKLTNDDLINLWMAGELALSVEHHGVVWWEERGICSISGYVQVDKMYAESLLLEQDNDRYHKAMTGTFEGRKFYCYPPDSGSSFILVNRAGLLVMSDEVSRFKERGYTGGVPDSSPEGQSNEWVYIDEARCKASGLSLTTFRKRVKEASDIEFDHDQDKKMKKRLREVDFYSIIHETYKK